MPLDLSDDERAQLAKDLAAELDTGLYGNRAVLSRRQLLSIAGGSAGVAGLTALGVDPATAQSAAGQVGTESSPEDVFAFDLDVQNGAEFNGTDVTGVGSFSTDKLSVAESGVYNAGSIDPGGFAFIDITFSESYSQPPIMLHAPGDDTQDSFGRTMAQHVSATGFRLVVENVGDTTEDFRHNSWMALER